MKKLIRIIFIIALLAIIAIPNKSFADSEAEAHASVNYAPTFESDDKRGGWGPGGAHSVHPQLPSNFAPVPMTHEYVELERFIRDFKYEWSTNEVHNFLREDDLKNVEVEARPVTYLNPSNNLKVVFPQVRPRGNLVTEVGSIKTRSLKADTSMEAVFGMLLLEALQMGGNIVVPLNEGAARVLGVSGWALSLGYTQAIIGGNEQHAGVGGAGAGYAKGESSHRHDPFARFAVLHVPWDKYGQVQVFPPRPEKPEPKKMAKAEPKAEPEPKEKERLTDRQVERLKRKIEYMEQRADYYQKHGK